jgi:hypothetical protein
MTDHEYQQQLEEQQQQENTMKVYSAIRDVMSALSHEGISKGRKNQQQGYSFRGIDDIYNALSPAMAKAGLVVLPRVLSREVAERLTAKGGTLFYVTVEVEFDFVAVEDGSKHTVKTYGEAMDSADKATNKAMSAAYKYAALQAFCIPTEGDNDADGTTHELAPRQAAKPAPQTKTESRITAAQTNDLTLAIEAAGMSIADFCTTSKIKVLGELPASKLAGAKAWLLTQAAA